MVFTMEKKWGRMEDRKGGQRKEVAVHSDLVFLQKEMHVLSRHNTCFCNSVIKVCFVFLWSQDVDFAPDSHFYAVGELCCLCPVFKQALCLLEERRRSLGGPHIGTYEYHPVLI